ncbi:16S rRNA (uracil(1498)-N(3))-methyltransferase [Acetivibrio clariflavus]|uniref:Ribosomal RNA small subunit methyltransferase E n=1 Tax=Acetivibrio clariflavus (strain DSM 19732 / NBRC 101661 / EBR45) TaxID=720554 RepID=G8M309_ACECE|nr:16S rRNA (uracil(1498)-N(3))-methyltransferase [Acetivibrio clariflavus]AEV69318.1 RNA methyltransferase, RsmE family [Acetivibrio clariflavus DSM 19732]
MPRFFINSEDIFDDNINIKGDDYNHIKKVLRLKCGEIITLSDGVGNEYAARIEAFGDGFVHTKIVESYKNATEPPVKVTLYQGLPKSDKMDFIIQKSVELGISKVVPVLTERTVVKIDNQKDAQKKWERWNRISQEAAKQSNRGIIPEVELPISFKEAIKQIKNGSLSIIPYEKESKKSLKQILKSNGHMKDISVFIGPEGGFTEQEIEEAISFGINPVTLGPRILRTETAGIAVLSILMYEVGDVG